MEVPLIQPPGRQRQVALYEIEASPGLHSEFQAIWGYRKTYLKTTKQKQDKGTCLMWSRFDNLV